MPYTGNRSSSPKVTVSSIIYKKKIFILQKNPNDDNENYTYQDYFTLHANFDVTVPQRSI